MLVPVSLLLSKRKKDLEDCIPKATGDVTQWVYKVFQHQISRNNNPSKDQFSFEVDLAKIQSLDSNIANMNVESMKFWLAKFVQEVVNINNIHVKSLSLKMQLTYSLRMTKDHEQKELLLLTSDGSDLPLSKWSHFKLWTVEVAWLAKCWCDGVTWQHFQMFGFPIM